MCHVLRVSKNNIMNAYTHLKDLFPKKNTNTLFVMRRIVDTFSSDLSRQKNLNKKWRKKNETSSAYFLAECKENIKRLSYLLRE
jgi:hypothetical protein